VESAPRRKRGADCLNFRVLGKGERVFDVDPQITHRVLDFAMAAKNLDGTEVAGGLVDDRRLGSPE
jgi:hypothetical protein